MVAATCFSQLSHLGKSLFLASFAALCLLVVVLYFTTW